MCLRVGCLVTKTSSFSPISSTAPGRVSEPSFAQSNFGGLLLPLIKKEKEKDTSAEMEKFVETHICKLRVGDTSIPPTTGCHCFVGRGAKVH